MLSGSLDRQLFLDVAYSTMAATRKKDGGLFVGHLCSSIHSQIVSTSSYGLSVVILCTILINRGRRYTLGILTNLIQVLS